MTFRFCTFGAAMMILLGGNGAAQAQDRNYFGEAKPGTTPADVLPAPPAPPTVVFTAAGLGIVTALWGAGHVHADVTRAVSDALRQPASDFVVNADWLKCDPASKTPKDLLVVFEDNGTRYVMDAPEGAHFGVRVLREFVRDRSIPPPPGPALVGKLKPRTAEELRAFLAGTTWDVGFGNGKYDAALTFAADGTMRWRGGNDTGIWSVEGPATVKFYGKDWVTFNGDFTRFRAVGDALPYVGLLKQ